MADDDKKTKLKFTPTIPSTRIKQSPKSQQSFTPNQKPRKLKTKFQPEEATASGPFALGPAKKGIKITPSGGSSSRPSGVIGASGSKKFDLYEIPAKDLEDEEQQDVGFDHDDPWAPSTLQSAMPVSFQEPTDLFKSLSPSHPAADPSLETPKDNITSPLLFLQFPPILPLDLNNENPKGKVGKIRYYKSGKIILQLGNISFDITSSPCANMKQQLVSLNQTKDSLFVLGDVLDRHVCVPII